MGSVLRVWLLGLLGVAAWVLGALGPQPARGRNHVNRTPLFPKERPPRARVICPGRRP